MLKKIAVLTLTVKVNNHEMRICMHMHMETVKCSLSPVRKKCMNLVSCVCMHGNPMADMAADIIIA